MRDASLVLVWGPPSDGPFAAVRGALDQIGCPVIALDQREVLETEVELLVDSSSVLEGRLHTRSGTIGLDSITAAYLRPHDWRDLSSSFRSLAKENSPGRQHAQMFYDILASWADLTPAVVVNRPSATAANGSKPYQALWIEALGFRTPETLITTDPVEAENFWRKHGRVIYKSLSGIRSIVCSLTPNDRPRLDDVASCPTQFQQYVSGTEHRVHVVGEDVFACKIIFQGDDYRYSSEPVDMQPSDLPDDVAARCKTLARAMDLLVAGIDLRCTSDGDWYCFEVNPSPGFTYYQEFTSQPIARAVACLLASAQDATRFHGVSEMSTKP